MSKMPMYAYSNRELLKFESFVEQNFGKFDSVLHEIISPDIHLDIIPVPPTDEQPFYKLVTMGAGAYKMNVPKELKGQKLERAEYVIFLPGDWDLSSSDEKYYWAIRQLKAIARLPVNSGEWLGLGHTLSAHDDSSPVAENTKLNSFVLLAAWGKNQEFVEPLKLGLFKQVNFYQLLPLYQEELEFKLANSLNDLLRRFDDFSLIVDTNRKNWC